MTWPIPPAQVRQLFNAPTSEWGRKWKAGDIVTPVEGVGQVEVVAFGQIERLPVEQYADKGWRLALEDLQWALPFLAAVGAAG